MKVKNLKINFRYLGGNIACLSVDNIGGKSVHNDVNNEEAIIIFNSLIGEKENCKTIKSLLKENQELKKHLKVPENCNLKTLEDYKSYYEDTTREQILEDSYIDYCAYVNLAHRYSKLEKQLEEYKNSQSCSFVNICKSTKIANYYQQKEFIKYLEDEIERKRKNATCMFEYNDTVLPLKEVLQEYKEIIGGNE